MPPAEKIDDQELASKESVSLDTLVDRLGRDAAEVFFERIDDSQRVGRAIYGTTVRESRSVFGKARASGHAHFVVPRRPIKGSEKSTDIGDSIVIMKMEDLEAVVRAAREGFDWVKAFSPRSDLAAALSSAKIVKGSRGKRQLRASRA